VKYEVRKACNAFMYGSFVELVEIEPLDIGPLEPAIYAHPSMCSCPRCLNAGLRYADYLKARSKW
jgi:hypothetical protein